MTHNLTFDQKYNMMQTADISLAGWTRNMVIIVTAGVAIQQFHKNDAVKKGIAYIKIFNFKIPLLSIGALILIITGLIIGGMANWYYFKKIRMIHPTPYGINLKKYQDSIIEMQYDYSNIGTMTSVIIIVYFIIFLIIFYEFHKRNLI
jgi:uncharacterized membrane protein YidH (DUF202 family)